MTRSVTHFGPFRTSRATPAAGGATILLWILIALGFITGALLTLSVLQTTEYDRDAYSIVR